MPELLAVTEQQVKAAVVAALLVQVMQKRFDAVVAGEEGCGQLAP